MSHKGLKNGDRTKSPTYSNNPDNREETTFMQQLLTQTLMNILIDEDTIPFTKTNAKLQNATGLLPHILGKVI